MSFARLGERVGNGQPDHFAANAGPSGRRDAWVAAGRHATPHGIDSTRAPPEQMEIRQGMLRLIR